ncbi:YSIRK-type signal peptide-containing protein [Staphylococcus aureus]
MSIRRFTVGTTSVIVGATILFWDRQSSSTSFRTIERYNAIFEK